MRRIFLQCVVFLTLLTARAMLWASENSVNVGNAPASAASAKKIVTGTPDVMPVVLGLAAVVGLILLLGFFLKRFNPAVLQKNSLLKVVASQSLGQRERVVLLAVGEQQLVIGVTAQQITLLHTFAEPLPITNNVQSSFALQLQDVLMRRGS